MIVALVSSLYGPHAHGGAERVAQSVAETLAGQGHQVHVISLGKSGVFERAELNGVQVHYCPLRNLYWPFPVAPAGLAMKAAWHAIDAYNPAMAAGSAHCSRRSPGRVNTHNLAGFSRRSGRSGAAPHPWCIRCTILPLCPYRRCSEAGETAQAVPALPHPQRAGRSRRGT